MSQHKKMCRKCPWRKNSAPGWLGAASPEEFIRCIWNEVKLPCHSTINYEGDWQEKIESAPYCVGSLIATRKMCKRPIKIEHDRLVVEIQDDDNHLDLKEFLEHHGNAPVKSWEF